MNTIETLEIVGISNLDLIDPNQHDLFWDIVDLMCIYNSNADKVMSIREQDEFLALYIDDKEITVGEDFHIVDRIKQINRENAYFE